MITDANALLGMFTDQLPEELRPFVNVSCRCGARERDGNDWSSRRVLLVEIENRNLDADGAFMEHLALAGRWFRKDVELVARYCLCPDAQAVR